jgi:hypothetical protein
VGPNDTGTDPTLADTDGDGFDDGEEVAAGSDPLNPNSTPLQQVPVMGPVSALILAGGLALLATRSLRRRRSS